MKITETIERNCCLYRDLIPYNGECKDPAYAKNKKASFCQHCGQIWVMHRSAGEMDSGWEKVKPINISV